MLNVNHSASQVFKQKSRVLCHHPSVQQEPTKVKDTANATNLGQTIFLVSPSSLPEVFHWSSNEALPHLT